MNTNYNPVDDIGFKKHTMSDDKRKNPWGNLNDNNGGNRGRKGSGNGPGKRGGGRGGSGGGEPPHIDDVLRQAQDNFKNLLPNNMQSGGLIALGVIVVVILWLASGFYVVNPGEHAVIQRFGAWARTQADPGLGYHFPAPVETVEILNVEQIRKMNIGFAEFSTRGRGSALRDVPEESLMLTSDRNIVDLDVVIQWNIKSGEDYLFNIEDQENTIKKVAESAIREVVGQTRMFPIITTGRTAVSDKTREIIQTNLDEYKSGVNITQVLIERAEVHPDVQGAFQDVQSAKQDAEDAQNRSEAYREDILPKARGTAIQSIQEAEAYQQSVVAKSRGDAERFISIYNAYLSGKDVTKERLFIEAMEDVLGNASKIIMDNNGKNGTGVVPYLPLNQIQQNTRTR